MARVARHTASVQTVADRPAEEMPLVARIPQTNDQMDIGKVLREARQRVGLSREQITQNTKIPLLTVEARTVMTLGGR